MLPEEEIKSLKAAISAKDFVIEYLKAQVESLTAQNLLLEYGDKNCRCGEPLCANPACIEIYKQNIKLI
jgi:hypothetical protein